ncbi:glycosyltransferase family 2 protein [Desulfonatronovibrio magnus]|uniref:glycosyltransferase family 2 protein n=1 Tax=Desulfonatronovibrio magnus TaxID=698827 RepID=UPI0006977927|nr:glycosyltransferase family 2 protein [Desulfonatronovibrio magnus]
MLSDKPLVSIFTPAYNSEKYISECIESVLMQTYENWEYTIVDNCSTDNTKKIITEYVKKDNRIKLYSNKYFLPQIKNWNNGLKKINLDSKYCKVLHADDWLFPECIEMMVKVGEGNTNVGIISAYRLEEDRVTLKGLRYDTNVFKGHEICRKHLLSEIFVFGSPTALLIRTDIIKKYNCLYDEDEVHADTFACLKILKEWDFGFVHQVLTYTRRHNESVSSHVNLFDTKVLERIRALEKFGQYYLRPNVLQYHKTKRLRGYHRLLARRFFELRPLDYWKYHHNELNSIGLRVNWAFVGMLIALQIFRPIDTFPHIRKGCDKIYLKLKKTIKPRVWH